MNAKIIQLHVELLSEADVRMLLLPLLDDDEKEEGNDDELMLLLLLLLLLLGKEDEEEKDGDEEVDEDAGARDDVNGAYVRMYVFPIVNHCTTVTLVAPRRVNWNWYDSIAGTLTAYDCVVFDIIEAQR